MTVRCVNPIDDTAWPVGNGQGDGPGEFRSISSVVRGSEGRLGVVDVGLSRFSVFDASGVLLHTITTPSIFSPVGAFQSMLGGTSSTPGVLIAGGTLHRIGLPDGGVIETIDLVHPADAGMEVEATSGLSGGARDTEGRYTFGTGHRQLVLYDADGQLSGVFTAPRWQPQVPSDDEVDRFARTPLFGQRPSAADVAGYAKEPQHNLVSGRSLQADDGGRVWALTRRGSVSGTEIDVYEGGMLVSTVRTAARALGFDILGDQIVVLEEHRETDAEGLPVRRLNWYTVPRSLQSDAVPR